MHAATVRRRARLSAGFATQAAAAITKPSSLDISEIRYFPLQEPVSGNLYSLLAGADVKTLESVWLGKPAHTYAAITASHPLGGALDMALLDIIGKSCGAPIYRVLGGPTRNKVRAYSPRGTADFPIAIITVPIPAARNQGKAYQNQIRALVDAVPPGLDFVLAGNELLTPGDAASVAAAVEAKHPLWFDEPCSHSNLETVRKISGETVIPLGFGRGIRDAGVFQALLREGLVDLVRPELAFFGITGARRIAALAEPYYVAVAPRHEGGPVATAAAIHLAASIPNFFVQHLPVPLAAEDRAMRSAIFSPDVEQGRNGFLELPKGPGLGITVNESALEKYHAA